MRNTHIPIPWRYILRHAALGVFCAAGAFTLGMKTTADVQTFETTEAQSIIPDVAENRVAQRGDINEDGALTGEDAIILIHFSEGLETPTPREIQRGDLDGDYRITYRDVLRLLHTLPR